MQPGTSEEYSSFESDFSIDCPIENIDITDQNSSSEAAVFAYSAEAIWVAAEMRAGAAYAHSLIALDTIEDAARSEHAKS